MEKKGLLESVKSGASLLSKVLFSTLTTRIEEEADILLNKAEKKALLVQEKMAKRKQCAIILNLAGLCLLLAVFYAFVDTLGMTKASAFLIIGATLLIIGLFLKYKYLKEEGS